MQNATEVIFHTILYNNLSDSIFQMFKCGYFQTEAPSRLEEDYNTPISDSQTSMILLNLWLVNVATT